MSNNADEMKLVGDTDQSLARLRIARRVDEFTQLRMPRIPYEILDIVGADLGDLGGNAPLTGRVMLASIVGRAADV
jgi:hypothetical protein